VTERKFTLSRREQPPKADHTEVERFISGQEPETTKTFRLPVSLSRRLKIHAAEKGITEKEILIQLITKYLDEQL
jgi:hypothetical protein